MDSESEVYTYTVDPNWSSFIFSPALFISFGLTLTFCYVLCPILAYFYIPEWKIQSLGERKANLYSLFGSSVHAIVACVLALYAIRSGELGNNVIFSKSPLGFTILQITLGYVCGDLVICILDPYLSGVYSTLLHHVAMIAGISMCLFYQGFFLYFVVWRVLAEFSTPFVNFRMVVSELGDKRSWMYYFASIGMTVSFFSCRIVMIPWYTYELVVAIFFNPEVNIIPMHLQVYMFVNYTAFDILNIYWFFKILKGAYKLMVIYKVD